jgi:hypothetical protein
MPNTTTAAHPDFLFNVNNRYVGSGADQNPWFQVSGPSTIKDYLNSNGADAWFRFKQFMKDAGWTVPYSGVAYGSTHNADPVPIYEPVTGYAYYDGDMITSANLMDFPGVWFLLCDPSNERQYMFLRTPQKHIDRVEIDVHVPGVTAPLYLYHENVVGDRDLSNFFAMPFNPPIIGGTQFAGTEAEVVNVSGSDVTIMLPQVVSATYQGYYLYITNSTGTMTGTILIDTVSPPNQINITLAGATLGEVFDWKIVPEEAMMGDDATITGSGKIANISGLVNMTPKSVGAMLCLDAALPENSGYFLITEYVSATEVKCWNLTGWTDTDGYNGSIKWHEAFQVKNFLGLDSDRMSVAYSANNGFTSKVNGAVKINPITKTITNAFGVVGTCYLFPSIAEDMVFTTPGDMNLAIHQYPDWIDYDPITGAISSGGGSRYCDGTVKSVTNWNVHMAAKTTAPFYFYFMWTTTDTTDPAEKTNVCALFQHDYTKDSHSQDTDKSVIWNYVKLGAPSELFVNYNASKVSSIHNVFGQYINSWYKKPATFASRNEFVFKINSMQCGFLNTHVLGYGAGESTGAPNPTFCMVPCGMPTNMFDGKDELYPLLYGRGNTHPTEIYEPSANPPKIRNAFRLPPSYKGASEFTYLSGIQREPFDTLNVQGETRNYICLGNYTSIAIPWDGSIPNNQ